MTRVTIPERNESRPTSISIPPSVIAAQTYASLSLADTLLIASLTVFPAVFDATAGAAVTGTEPADFSSALEGLIAKGIVVTAPSSQPALFQLTRGAREFVSRLADAQDEINAARSRHDGYFLARLRGADDESPISLTNELFREFKRVNLEIAARRRIRRLVGLPERVARRPEGLTQRQWEVARLVAAGRTNFQIAQTMQISEWTVVNHLRAVMQRLGCSSRVDVARTVLT